MKVSPVAQGLMPDLKAGSRQDEEAKRAVAERFEAAFLSEMLKYSGVNKTSEGFGGGPGEDAFASFLTNAYADKLAAQGGIGLAEQIFRALQAKGSSS